LLRTLCFRECNECESVGYHFLIFLNSQYPGHLTGGGLRKTMGNFRISSFCLGFEPSTSHMCQTLNRIGYDAEHKCIRSLLSILLFKMWKICTWM